MDIIKILNSNKKLIEEAIKIDKEEWEYEFNFERILEIIEENKKIQIPKNTKNEIVSNVNKIVVIGNINPEVLVNLISKFLKLEIQVTFFLQDKLLATNQVILEVLAKEIKKFSYIKINKKDEFYEKQEEFDICLYIGKKQEYLDFSRRLKIFSVYQNYGEIYTFFENKDFKPEMLELEKFSYNNDIETKYYIGKIEEGINYINSIGPVQTIGIFTKDIETAYKIANEIYAENIYINVDLTKKYKFEFNIEKLLYKKKIVLK